MDVVLQKEVKYMMEKEVKMKHECEHCKQEFDELGLELKDLEEKTSRWFCCFGCLSQSI